MSTDSRTRPNAKRTIAAAPSKICIPTQTLWAVLIDFLSHRFPHIHRDEWALRFAQGRITDALTGHILQADSPCLPGRWIHYYREVEKEKDIPASILDDIRIVHEDEQLLVVDKPHFLPVVPSGAYITNTLLHQLRVRTKIDTLSPAHRIDRDTAGLVIFTKQANNRAAYQRLFQNRHVEKTYLAIARWNSDLFATCPSNQLLYQSHLARSPHHFMQQIELYDKAPNAQTVLRCMRLLEPQEINNHVNLGSALANTSLALYQLQPITGQRHQLRVHMNALGMPIIGDNIYPILSPEGMVDWTQPLCLLAQSIRFQDPFTGQVLDLQSQRELCLRLNQDPQTLAVLNRSTPYANNHCP